MITYQKGDLLDAVEPVIVHGCNNKGVMRSGVAKAIRAKWSEAYKVYKDASSLPMGDIIPIFSIPSNKWIINAITQDGYGRDGRKYVCYDAIAKCFRDINTFCAEMGYDSIAIPKIGAGLGGGDWDVIEEIILDKMTDIDVVVYTL